MRIAFLSLILLLAACEENSRQHSNAEVIRPAKVRTVARAGAELQYEFPARIEALQSVDLSFEVGGPLAELPIREGAELRKGALVAALDPTDFQLAVREAEVQLKLAAQDLNRKRKVLEENGIAKSQVEDARSHYELQRVRLSKAIEQLDDSKIYTPFDAVISQRFFDRHVNIRPGQPVVRILDTTQLQVIFSAPEQLVASTSPERLIRAWAEFSFAPGEEFELSLYENRGEADSLAQTYEISLTMDNPAEWNILPGMTTTVKLRLKGAENGLMLVPASALVPAANSELFVWVFDPETQMVRQQPIQTGPPQQDGVPVISGLQNGEQIIVTGATHLQAGMRVQPL